jgi:hypothetical protein
MKNKYTKIVTPIGVAQYPWLTQADTKFSEVGEYKTNLIVNKKDAQEVIKIIDTAREESTKNAVEQSKGKKVKVADAPYYDEVDDDGKPTGNVIFKFKCKAKVTTKSGESFENKPTLFDAKGKPMLNVNVWGGSEIKVSAELIPYFTSMVGAGVSMRLRAAQIIKLIEGGSNSSGYGFKEEEGYEHSETTMTEEFANDSKTEVSEDKDDF